MIEEHHSFFRSESFHWILYFDVDFELHYFLQLTDVDVVANVESEEETANESLCINDFSVYRFYDNSKHRGMLKPKVFKLYLPLS